MSSRPVARGALIGRGGEGDVYDVPDQPDLVAKVYHKAPSPDRIAKLEAMVGLREDRLAEIAAWPVKLLRDRGSTVVRGFLMPKVKDHHPIHHLYSPKSRAISFPETDFRFLVHTAMNLARAFDRVHATGCVIGDVNYGNVMVSSKAMVKLIDCDSFQIQDRAGRIFRCEVGEPTFVPPELQGSELRKIDRNRNHDAFGLAILIFHLLFQGRHPFAGRFQGTGDMGIERAIREHRFAYGRTGKAMRMEPPPYSLQLAEISREVAALFEQTFAPENARGGHRPMPAAWSVALEALGRHLAICSVNPAHFFVTSGVGCPWCTIEAGTGAILFQTKLVGTPPSATADLTAVWAEIEAVATPPSNSPPPLQSRAMPSPSQPALAIRQKVISSRIGGGILAILTFLSVVNAGSLGIELRWLIGATGILAAAILGFRGGGGRHRREYQQNEQAVSERYHALERTWSERASNAAFLEKRRQLEAVRQELQQLPHYRDEQLRKLEANRREAQLRAFLEQFEIADAAIDGIGVTRKATLLSYGVETAEDINEHALSRVPGVGPTLAKRLLRWRAGLQSRFRFDATKAVDPKQLLAITRDVQIRQSRLEAQLRAGPSELARIAASIHQRQGLLRPQIDAAARELRQAQANLRAIN